MASVADLRKLVAACDAADAATLNAVANAAKEGGLAAEPHLVPALSGILKACAHKVWMRRTECCLGHITEAWTEPPAQGPRSSSL